VRFRTTILSAGKTAAGIVIPPEVVAALGSSRKPPVRVTIRDYTYRSTVATIDGRFMVGVSAENRAKAGVAGGDEVDVDIELDTEPRTVELPADFAAALEAEPKAKSFFDGLSNSQKGWFVGGIEGAKTAETRQRRIDGALDRLRKGRGQR
jgi:Bacteriocin-protection, YdeI or OmpD-Associated/Domain of unknown function (DUF1905)